MGSLGTALFPLVKGKKARNPGPSSEVIPNSAVLQLTIKISNAKKETIAPSLRSPQSITTGRAVRTEIKRTKLIQKA